MRFPLQGAVLLETSYISLDDRFAAQIDLFLLRALLHYGG